MEDLFYLVLILLFFLAPLIERVLRGRRRGQAPPPADLEQEESEAGPYQRPRPEYTRPRGTSTGPTGVEQWREPATAAEEVIPDDLWEILTGERRRPRPGPEPEPEYGEPVVSGPAVEERDWEIDAEEPLEPARLPEPGPEIVQEPWRRKTREPEERARITVHGPIPAPREARLAPPPPAPPIRPEFEWDAARRRPKVVELGLHDRTEVRRAVVLREVLGPPKGLEW